MVTRYKKESLCWYCSRGANECDFMRKLQPIDGWKAKKVEYNGYYGATYTYVVEKCPNFEPMRQQPQPKKPKWQEKGTKTCPMCGATFTYKSDRKVYCSNACHIKAYRAGVRC